MSNNGSGRGFPNGQDSEQKASHEVSREVQPFYLRYRKFIIAAIAVILLSLLLFGRESSPYTLKPTTREDNLDTVKEIASMAVSAGDVQKCEGFRYSIFTYLLNIPNAGMYGNPIVIPEAEGECYYHYALFSNDPSICDNSTSPWGPSSYECYKDYANIKSEPNVCLLLSNDEAQGRCLAQFELYSSDLSTCDLSNSESVKKLCAERVYHSLKRHEVDFGQDVKCEEVTNPELANHCYQRSANSEWDFNICLNNIELLENYQYLDEVTVHSCLANMCESSMDRDQCYGFSAIKSNDSALCSLIINEEIRGQCLTYF